MNRKSNHKDEAFRLVTLIEPELLVELDALAKQGGLGITRSDIVRGILRRAIEARRTRRRGVRAAG